MFVNILKWERDGAIAVNTDNIETIEPVSGGRAGTEICFVSGKRIRVAPSVEDTALLLQMRLNYESEEQPFE